MSTAFKPFSKPELPLGLGLSAHFELAEFESPSRGFEKVAHVWSCWHTVCQVRRVQCRWSKFIPEMDQLTFQPHFGCTDLNCINTIWMPHDRKDIYIAPLCGWMRPPCKALQTYRLRAKIMCNLRPVFKTCWMGDWYWFCRPKKDPGNLGPCLKVALNARTAHPIITWLGHFGGRDCIVL